MPQSADEGANLQAICDWCSRWCTQDVGFRQLTTLGLCRTGVKVCMNCIIKLCVRLALSAVSGRVCKQMSFWQRSTNSLGLPCFANANTRKHLCCIQVTCHPRLAESLACTLVSHKHLTFVTFADCLAALDETTITGAATACEVHCNRALALLRMDPPDAETALSDARCATEHNQDSSKASHMLSCSVHIC